MAEEFSKKYATGLVGHIEPVHVHSHSPAAVFLLGMLVGCLLSLVVAIVWFSWVRQ